MIYKIIRKIMLFPFMLMISFYMLLVAVATCEDWEEFKGDLKFIRECWGR